MDKLQNENSRFSSSVIVNKRSSFFNLLRQYVNFVYHFGRLHTHYTLATSFGWCLYWINIKYLSGLRYDLFLLAGDKQHSKSQELTMLRFYTIFGAVFSWKDTMVEFLLYSPSAIGGDKVSMLTHTYLHKPPRKKVTYAITRLTAHFMLGLISDLVICKFRKSMAECPYQVSLNNTNPNHLSNLLIVKWWPLSCFLCGMLE